jgi:hypothetical protein
MMNPTLIVTVDTEEEGLWSGQYRVKGNTLQNLRGIPRFQALCEQYSIRPTYLIDAAVVGDEYGCELFRGWSEEDRCEIGAHLHPWCNPPFEESPGSRNSYLCNLDVDLQRRKIQWLTDQISQRVGRVPRSFRAGRYGLDGNGAQLLVEAGYSVDSSVIAFSDFRPHGPDFRDAPVQPYWVRPASGLLQPQASGALLEVPVSVGFNRHNFGQAVRWRERASRAPWKQLRGVGWLDRTGLARRIKFSPEQADAKGMCTLVDAYLAQSAPVMVLMLHSSSLMVGGSPYVPTAARLDRLFDDLSVTFDYCVRQRGMTPHTLSDMAPRTLEVRR